MHDIQKVQEINDRHRDPQGFRRSNHRSLKLDLLAEFGTCHWCDTPVVDVIQVEGMRMPDNGATLDHTKSRWERMPGEWVLKVLSCYKCNWHRDRKQVRDMMRKTTPEQRRRLAAGEAANVIFREICESEVIHTT